LFETGEKIMDWSSLIDTSKLAGWVRSGVGAALAVAIAKWPALSSILDPSTQAALGVAVSGVAVGVWSHFVKTQAQPNASIATPISPKP
jgi:hypothetical protein